MQLQVHQWSVFTKKISDFCLFFIVQQNKHCSMDKFIWLCFICLDSWSVFKSTSGRSVLFSELPGFILRCQPSVQRVVFPKVGQGGSFSSTGPMCYTECHLGWGHGKRSARKLILSLGLCWNMSILGSWHFVFRLRNSLVGYFRSVHKCYKAGRQADILV